MRIQFILNYSDLYGANRSVLSVIRSFQENGHKVNVLIPSKGEILQELKSRNISCDVVPFYSAFLYIKPVLKHLLIPLLTFVDVFLFPLVVLRVKKFDPDIIYSNTSAENVGIFVAKFLRKKHILHVREFMEEDHGARFVFGKKMKSKFINMSDASIYVSKAVLNAIHGTGSKNPKHQVIYNGIASEKLKLKEKNIDDENLVFGIVGILDPAKGQDKAIVYFKEILKEYPNAKLLIYGDKEGAFKEKLIKLVEDFNLTENILFLGFESDLDKIYDSIDVLLMFSKSEGFGRVTIEAAFNGVPVVGFDNAGTSELIVDRETGCLFKDLKTFEKAISFLIKDEHSYKTIRNCAFENAWNLYSQDVYCSNVEQFVIDLYQK
jgi:glycosyltransferase involved in cell wall biosynthesis